MPTLSFFPWVTITARLQFEAFHLTPFATAVAAGEVPAELAEAAAVVLSTHAKPRAVDRERVPVLRRDDLAMTAELTDAAVADYFAFRLRLTFAALASRRFFEHRYRNSDNLRLVIQGFRPERAGAAAVLSRRRDGAVNNLISEGQRRETRPHHVSGWCELPRDLDVPLLHALEAATARGAPDLVARLDDAIRLFVGANTDSPDVLQHSELVDLVSAFGRLFDEWKEDGTVRAFLKLLSPPSLEYPSRVPRPRAAHPRVEAGLKKEPARAVWLRDAFVLRHQYGHGRVTAPGYAPAWSEREHLLLGAVALPLAVKAVLRGAGFYAFTAEDETLDRALDDLALVEPFAAPADPEDPSSPWRDVLTESAFRPLIGAFANATAAEFGTGAAGSPTTAPAANPPASSAAAPNASAPARPRSDERASRLS